MKEDLIKSYFDTYNIEYSTDKIKKFIEYYSLLIENNKKFNLTTIVEEEEFVIKHLVDSLFPYRKMAINSKVVDIGSGGGFPALPLKIIRSDLNILMVEATKKKVGFLNTVVENLKLKNIKAIQQRAEIIGRLEEYREKFDICTARGFAPLNALCEYLAPFVAVGGKIIAYKGPEVFEEIKNSKNAFEKLNLRLLDVEKIDLEENKRTLVYIQKTAPLNEKYPRTHKKITNNPL